MADRAALGAHPPPPYPADVVAWLGWLAGRVTGALAAGRLHVDLWAATQLDGGGSLQRAPPSVGAVLVLPVLRGP